MKLHSLILTSVVLGSFSVLSSANPAVSLRNAAADFDSTFFEDGATPAMQASSTPAALDAVLKKMDAVAATFHSAEAEFEWDTYEKVIDEVDDIQTGTIFYRKNGANIEMMAEVKKAGQTLKEQRPEPKFVLFSQGKVQMFQPKV